MRRQRGALDRPVILAAVMKNKIPRITIGTDLGDKSHAICVLDKAGEIIEQRSITNHRDSLRRLSQKYPKARIAMEVGTHSPWISRFWQALGHEVIVANPRKLRAIYTSTRKSDQTDACMIARKCSKIVPLFRGSADRVKFAHAQKTFRRASARGLPRCPLRGGGIPPTGPAPVGRPVQRRTQPAG